MSTARGRDRSKIGRRGHLVLVRGGLDRATPEDADWQAFCARIGWQQADAALPDDYEDRLAARFFGEVASRDGRIARGADEGFHDGASVHDPRPKPRPPAEAWPPGGASDPWRPGARRASMAAATMAVAAGLCVAASVVLWRSARPAVSAVACPDVAAPRRATIFPVDDRAAPVDPSERRRAADPLSRPPETQDAPTQPAPTETKPRKPPAPGALVARRSQHGDARLRGSSRPVVLARRAEPAPSRDWHDDAAEVAAPMAPADLQAMASALGLPQAGQGGVTRALPVIPRAWPDAPASDAWVRPASFARVAPASASWSLSPGNPRWYGLGLAPASASAGVPPGVGVMGQLDVAKVLDRL